MRRPISVFSGATRDGHPWVLTFEGGTTSTGGTRCRVSGRIGPDMRVDWLSAVQGGELRSLLPSLNLGEVDDELRVIRE